MMKTAFAALASAVLSASFARGINYDVASCADLASVDDTAVTSLTITSSPIVCEQYTRFRVRNSMTLSATVDEVEFDNVAMKVLGSLAVEPDVIFKGVDSQIRNGGALYVQEGAEATFMGTATYIGNSIFSEEFELPSGAFTSKVKKGGAIHNKGSLVFQDDATFTQNEGLSSDSVTRSRGGAISNTAKGIITFQGKLTMTMNDCRGSFEGQGGGIYNRGHITVEGESSFIDNSAASGGAIYMEPPGTMTFNSFASFDDNLARDSTGGAIRNVGELNLLGGSHFLSNYASSSGDGGLGGAIYNSQEGAVTFGGDTTFDNNMALLGGAIYNGASASLTAPQDGGDFIFQNLAGDTCPGIYYAEDSGDFTCGP